MGSPVGEPEENGVCEPERLRVKKTFLCVCVCIHMRGRMQKGISQQTLVEKKKKGKTIKSEINR